MSEKPEMKAAEVKNAAAEANNAAAEPAGCTHNCSTCESACDQQPKKDFFTVIEDFVKETEKDEIQEMFAKIAEEIGE